MSAPPSKADFRAEMRRRVAAIVDAERAEKDAEIRRRIAALAEYGKASQILAFVPMPDEPDINPLLARAVEEGRRVYAPVVESDWTLRFVEWSPRHGERARPGGHWDAVSDEAPGAHASIVLVPALAIDGRGYRLGRGRGCYDRCMDALSTKGSTVAVIYECQLVGEVPRQRHDTTVDCVITEARTVYPASERP